MWPSTLMFTQHNFLFGYVEMCSASPSYQVFDESALSQRCKEEMYKCYPDAKRAHLKSGGNFPYLSRSSEVNLMLQVSSSTFSSSSFPGYSYSMVVHKGDTPFSLTGPCGEVYCLNFVRAHTPKQCKRHKHEQRHF